jgi:glyoxylase-like metal-dependent hydrolase (beta-lactamase superfamily II)
MSKLIALTDRVWYAPGAVQSGFLVKDNKAILIDSGVDREAGKRLDKEIRKQSWSLSAIINTHAHVDHYGGNAYLLEAYKEAGLPLTVYAPPIEATGMENPILEPMYLYFGAAPLPDMLNRFLYAPASPVHSVLLEGTQTVDWAEVEILLLPGHSINQAGIGFDGVLMAADSFFGPEVLEKHGIPFLVNARETLLSLDRLAETDYAYYVPGHGEAVKREGLNLVLQANRVCHEKWIDYLDQAILKKTQTLGELVKACCDEAELQVKQTGAYALYQTAIAAYLSYLAEEGRITAVVEDNVWLWQSK